MPHNAKKTTHDKDFEIIKQGHVLYEEMLILEEQGVEFMITAAILWIRMVIHWGHPIVSSGKSYQHLPASGTEAGGLFRKPEIPQSVFLVNAGDGL